LSVLLIESWNDSGYLWCG